MRRRISGQIHQATRFQQSNVASLDVGGGAIRSVKMPKKAGKRHSGGKKGGSERELNDMLKGL